MQTITQDDAEKVARPTTNVRVYESSAADLMQIQVDEYRKTGSKPTQAELVERALELYKSQNRQEQPARKRRGA